LLHSANHLLIPLPMNRVKYIDLGFKDYKETWDLQQEIQNNLIRARNAGDTSGVLPCLLFVEHPHVYTLGKSGKENNLLIQSDLLQSISATFYKTDRGGDITYHGPGQLVGYPIFDLNRMHMGVKKYIANLEESIIQTLAGYDIQASRLEGATGVWISSAPQPRKICAIGVKVSHSITMHGFALNVNTNLTYFNHINPCGFTDKGVTSIQQELGHHADMIRVKQQLLQHLERCFAIDFDS
jgi:lipoyl(octanoyl) transferase